jgi:acetylornithine deacetylase/succinyl-diaminopimelate desuccinylase-like protein
MNTETILQNLIQFDTTNPPGNEGPCIAYVQNLLSEAGLDSKIFAKDENRPNLVCRIKGKGEAPPILVYGHVDVVTTKGQTWAYPPFDGQIVDGYVWGRGAIDMKGGIAMMISALLRLQEEGIQPAGDVIFLALSDEENSGTYGADFMVNEHPEVFDGVKYALGEIGGFNMTVGGKRFYPIQVAEKQICELKITLEGPGGHAMGIVPNNAMEKLGVVLNTISNQHLPFHVTPPAAQMINHMADAMAFPLKLLLKLLLVPGLSEVLLKNAGAVGMALFPMFHNTVNATIVRGGEKNNVIPSKVELLLDGRALPGIPQEGFMDELKSLISQEGIHIELVNFDRGPANVDMGLFSHLARVIKTLDPDGVPIPYLLTAVTDARFLSELGIQSYGFIPMKLPPDFDFLNQAHAENERIPIEALHFGAEGIYQALVTYKG